MISFESDAKKSNEEEEEKPRVSEQEGNNVRVSKVEEEEEEEGSRVSELRSESSFDFEEREQNNISAVGDCKSLWSEFDDFIANEKNEAMEGTSRALSYGFEVGDMVWGKVKSHPWWPGHIFNEAFASSSVRRTRREGHVLVAFFGDSSYGWFDPAELIPFDANFAEKSQQTNSRTFIRAVEEATDEASRRSALGLACKCRNKYNIRPVNVAGYFAVDVPDYEPGGVYSVNQIMKARDGFKPGEALAFVKQLAAGPHGCDQDGLDFIKNKARVSAFRKAVFEEFDETYAQAFGVHNSRPLNDTAKVSNQLAKEPTRAPLSGPLVIAEALGGEKSSKKPIKVKEHSKRDKYLLQRRDEPNDPGTFEIVQRQASSSSPAIHVEGSSAAEAGDYVLQKRAPAPHISAKHEQSPFINKEGVDSSEDVAGKAALLSDQAPGYGGASLNAKPSLDNKDAVKEMKGEPVSDVADNLKSAGWSDLPGKEQLKGVSGFQDGGPGSHLSPLNASQSGGTSTGSGVKKVKVVKRPTGPLSSETSIMGEKKKKKKKELGAETNPDHPKKRLATGKGGVAGISSGKSTQISMSPGEDFQLNSQKKDVGASNTLPNSIELELPQLLSDLHALALDPFHGAERNSPSVTMSFFLRFRSLVYQKSLALSPPSETELVEARGAKSSSNIGASDYSASENSRGLTSSKAAKSLARLDDPTKAGRKRLPSDRQEEIAAKRLKKISHLKSLAAGKKAGQRSLDTQRAEGKEPMATQRVEGKEPVATQRAEGKPPATTHRAEGKQPVAQAPRKLVKPDSYKKMEPPVRATEPTMLVMKFPPETSLPSAAQLKAKFARFGSIDQSAIRVFWKSSQCRVVFRRKLDAQAALRYAVGNKSLFGNVNVRYNLREVGAPASEAPESEKSRGDDTSVDATQAKDPLVERQAAAFAHQPPSQSAGQLKSILKKPNGEEAVPVPGGNGGRGTRVKFILGGEETNRGEQMMVGNRNNFNNNASFADGGAPSTTTTVAMDFSSKNFQKVIPPSPLPILPLPTQFANDPLNNSHHHTELPPRNLHNFMSPPPSSGPSSAPSIDISQQMLSLLTTCNDLVTSVSGLLGYVPYHPL
ncbi:PWWP domain-containing protein 1-like [Populus alba]|uniref:PWWP domain-containing protein 1-like n=1 Tax=Populus alba TaxID=43335 RepID=UPI003CC76579